MDDVTKLYANTGVSSHTSIIEAIGLSNVMKIMLVFEMHPTFTNRVAIRVRAIATNGNLLILSENLV